MLHLVCVLIGDFYLNHTKKTHEKSAFGSFSQMASFILESTLIHVSYILFCFHDAVDKVFGFIDWEKQVASCVASK